MLDKRKNYHQSGQTVVLCDNQPSGRNVGNLKNDFIASIQFLKGIIVFIFAIMLFACPFTQPSAQAPPVPSAQQAPSSVPNITPNASANAFQPDKTEQDWAMISKENVENACLSQAKAAAVAKGYNEGMVFSCSCIAQESPGFKSYDCSISALDGEHSAGITCIKSGQTCSIDSQEGTATYTFDDLQALVN